MAYNLNKECELLWRCVDSSAEESGRYLDTSVLERLNWQAVLDIANRNRLIPLLYYYLKQYDSLQRVPEPFAGFLEKSYYSSVERGIRIMDDYQSISKILADAGIPHRPIKGVARIGTIYNNNPALRPVTDIDIFIPQPAKKEARRIFYSLGYELMPPVATYDYHDMFVKQGRIIDAHTRLFADGVLSLFPDFDIGDSLDELGIVGGRPYAALHYMINKSRPAIWLCDIIRLKDDEPDNIFFDLKQILRKVDKIISEARNGDYADVFFGARNYNVFWIWFILKLLCYETVKRPVKAAGLMKRVVQWRISRVMSKRIRK